MMNLSDLLTSIKMDIGIYGMTLPFANDDEVLKDVIRLKTVPTFSRYAPYRMMIKFEKNDLIEVERMGNYITFLIPDVFGDRKIISIDSVSDAALEDTVGLDAYGGYPFSVCDYKNMMLNAQSAQTAHYALPKFTFDFIEPNKLVLYNMSMMSDGLLCEVALSHDTNLSTIDEGHSEAFMKLALLDIKRFLFNAMRNYDEIQTSYGTYKLRTDEWSGAESDRNELLRDWDESFHLEAQSLYYL